MTPPDLEELAARVESGQAEALRPDQEPGFWNEWQPPRSEVARAIQYPIDKPEWPSRVLNAYRRDTRPAALRAMKEEGR